MYAAQASAINIRMGGIIRTCVSSFVSVLHCRGGLEPTTSGFVGFGAFGGAASSSAIASPASPALTRVKSAGGGDAYDSDKTPGSPAADLLYQGEDSELRAVLRRVAKKDETTKLKALQDLCGLIRARASSSSTGADGSTAAAAGRGILKDFLPAWCTGAGTYPALCLHNDRRARAGCMAVMKELVSAGMKKSFVPYLPSILPDWLLLCRDPAAEVSRGAESALALLLDSDAKQHQAIAEYSKDIVNTMSMYLNADSEDLSDMRISTVEEASERIERVHATACDVLSWLVARCHAASAGGVSSSVATSGSSVADATSLDQPIDNLDQSAAAEIVGAAADAPSDASASLQTQEQQQQHQVNPALAPLAAVLREIFSNKTTWRHLNSKSGMVQRAAYRLLAAVCAHMPGPITSGFASLTLHGTAAASASSSSAIRVPLPTSHLLQAAVTGACSNPSSAAWSTLLSFTRAFPAIWGWSGSGDGDVHRSAMLASAARSASSDSEPAATAPVATLQPLLDAHKALWPRLCDMLRHSCYGNGDAVYASLPQLLSRMPIRCLVDAGDQAERSPLSQVLLALISGLRNNASDEILPSHGQQLLVQSFADCAVVAVAMLTREAASASSSMQLLVDTSLKIAGFLHSLATSTLGQPAIAASQDVSAQGTIATILRAASVATSEGGLSRVPSASLRQAILTSYCNGVKRLHDVASRRRSADGSATAVTTSVGDALGYEVLVPMWSALQTAVVASIDSAAGASVSNVSSTASLLSSLFDSFGLVESPGLVSVATSASTVAAGAIQQCLHVIASTASSQDNQPRKHGETTANLLTALAAPPASRHSAYRMAACRSVVDLAPQLLHGAASVCAASSTDGASSCDGLVRALCTYHFTASLPDTTSDSQAATGPNVAALVSCLNGMLGHQVVAFVLDPSSPPSDAAAAVSATLHPLSICFEVYSRMHGRVMSGKGDAGADSRLLTALAEACMRLIGVTTRATAATGATLSSAATSEQHALAVLGHLSSIGVVHGDTASTAMQSVESACNAAFAMIADAPAAAASAAASSGHSAATPAAVTAALQSACGAASVAQLLLADSSTSAGSIDLTTPLLLSVWKLSSVATFDGAIPSLSHQVVNAEPLKSLLASCLGKLGSEQVAEFTLACQNEAKSTLLRSASDHTRSPIVAALLVGIHNFVALSRAAAQIDWQSVWEGVGLWSWPPSVCQLSVIAQLLRWDASAVFTAASAHSSAAVVCTGSRLTQRISSQLWLPLRTVETCLHVLRYCASDADSGGLAVLLLHQLTGDLVEPSGPTVQLPFVGIAAGLASLLPALKRHLQTTIPQVLSACLSYARRVAVASAAATSRFAVLESISLGLATLACTDASRADASDRSVDHTAAVPVEATDAHQYLARAVGIIFAAAVGSEPSGAEHCIARALRPFGGTSHALTPSGAQSRDKNGDDGDDDGSGGGDQDFQSVAGGGAAGFDAATVAGADDETAAELVQEVLDAVVASTPSAEPFLNGNSAGRCSCLSIATAILSLTKSKSAAAAVIRFTKPAIELASAAASDDASGELRSGGWLSSEAAARELAFELQSAKLALSIKPFIAAVASLVRPMLALQSMVVQHWKSETGNEDAAAVHLSPGFTGARADVAVLLTMVTTQLGSWWVSSSTGSAAPSMAVAAMLKAIPPPVSPLFRSVCWSRGMVSIAARGKQPQQLQQVQDAHVLSPAARLLKALLPLDVILEKQIQLQIDRAFSAGADAQKQLQQEYDALKRRADEMLAAATVADRPVDDDDAGDDVGSEAGIESEDEDEVDGDELAAAQAAAAAAASRVRAAATATSSAPSVLSSVVTPLDLYRAPHPLVIGIAALARLNVLACAEQTGASGVDGSSPNTFTASIPIAMEALAQLALACWSRRHVPTAVDKGLDPSTATAQRATLEQIFQSLAVTLQPMITNASSFEPASAAGGRVTVHHSLRDTLAVLMDRTSATLDALIGTEPSDEASVGLIPSTPVADLGLSMVNTLTSHVNGWLKARSVARDRETSAAAGDGISSSESPAAAVQAPPVAASPVASPAAGSGDSASSGGSGGGGIFGFASSILRTGASMLGIAGSTTEKPPQPAIVEPAPAPPAPVKLSTPPFYSSLAPFASSKTMKTATRLSEHSDVHRLFVSVPVSETESYNLSKHTDEFGIEAEGESIMLHYSTSAVCRRGRALVPHALCATLEDTAAPYALELAIDAICNRPASKSGASSTAVLATSVAGLAADVLGQTHQPDDAACAHAEAYLRSAYLALRCVQRAPSGEDADNITTYLLQQANGSPPSAVAAFTSRFNGDTSAFGSAAASSAAGGSGSPRKKGGKASTADDDSSWNWTPGCDLSRPLEACFHMLLHVADSRKSSGGTGPSASSSSAASATSLISTAPASSVPDDATATLAIPYALLQPCAALSLRESRIHALCFAFIFRFATVLPVRLADAVASLPRGLGLEVHQLVASQITPKLFGMQLQALRSAMTAGADSGSSGGGSLSLTALGCLSGDLAGTTAADACTVEAAIDDAVLALTSSTSTAASASESSSAAAASAGGAGDGHSHAHSAKPKFDLSVLKIRASTASREVTCGYEAGEANLSMKIAFPRAFPCNRVVVTCEQRVGITESQWRRVEMQIVKMMSGREGRLADAFAFFKQVVDREFEGVEPCPICYCTIALTNKQLPRTACPTCNNKFHSDCLGKWFNTSKDATCPLCRQPFR